MTRFISFVLALTLLMASCVSALENGGSLTPPSRESRGVPADRTIERIEVEADAGLSTGDSYEEKTRRPVVDLSQYKNTGNKTRPERPVVNLSDDTDSCGTVSRSDRPVVDLTDGKNEGGTARPQRPVVDTTEDANDSKTDSDRPVVDTVDCGQIFEQSTVDKIALGSQESVMDFGAFKALYKDVDAFNNNYTAIKNLTKHGVLSGSDDGYFYPRKAVTRAEFVKMLYYAYGFKYNSPENAGISFSDVRKSHWAYDYIMCAYKSGIINGKDDGTFCPDSPVNFAECAKMVLCCRGWSSESQEAWPYGYINAAKERKLFKGTSVIASGDYFSIVTREEAAGIINALYPVTSSDFGGIGIKGGSNGGCFAQMENGILNIYIPKTMYAGLEILNPFSRPISPDEASKYTWYSSDAYCKVDEYGTLSAFDKTGTGSISLLDEYGAVVQTVTVNVVSTVNVSETDDLVHDGAYIGLDGNGLIKNIHTQDIAIGEQISFDFYNELYIPMQISVYDKNGNLIYSCITDSVWGETGIVEGFTTGMKGLPIFRDMITGDAWKGDYVVPNSLHTVNSVYTFIPYGGKLVIDYPQQLNDAQIAFAMNGIFRSFASSYKVANCLSAKSIDINKIFSSKAIGKIIKSVREELGNDFVEAAAFGFIQMISDLKTSERFSEAFNSFANEFSVQKLFTCILENAAEIGVGATKNVADEVIMSLTGTDFILDPLFAIVDIGQLETMLSQGIAAAKVKKARYVITCNK